MAEKAKARSKAALAASSSSGGRNLAPRFDYQIVMKFAPGYPPFALRPPLRGLILLFYSPGSDSSCVLPEALRTCAHAESSRVGCGFSFFNPGLAVRRTTKER
jgi:hypothetical protein